MVDKISVVMAVYNGEKYLCEQIESIICQLTSKDELVISYNESSDNTLDIIKYFESKDSRIHVFLCKETGVIANFNNAISHAKGDIVFLCDQDDIWESNKVKEVLKVFKVEEIILVEHNCQHIDCNGNYIKGDLFNRRHAKKGLIKNLLFNSYQGSCIAFRNELMKYVLPIPTNIAMHDQWIGLIAEKCGGVKLLNKKLIKYRRHENAVSDVNIDIIKKVKSILITLCLLIKRYSLVKKAEK